MSTSGGNGRECLEAASKWARLADLWLDASAIDAYRTSLELMSSLVASGSSLEARHARLNSGQAPSTHTLAVEAASCAISLEEIKTAVELLEQGRSVLLTQAGRYRTRVDELEAINPSLAQNFKNASRRMEGSIMASESNKFNTASNTETEDAVAQ